MSIHAFCQMKQDLFKKQHFFHEPGLVKLNLLGFILQVHERLKDIYNQNGGKMTRKPH